MRITAQEAREVFGVTGVALLRAVRNEPDAGISACGGYRLRALPNASLQVGHAFEVEVLPGSREREIAAFDNS